MQAAAKHSHTYLALFGVDSEDPRVMFERIQAAQTPEEYEQAIIELLLIRPISASNRSVSNVTSSV